MTGWTMPRHMWPRVTRDKDDARRAAALRALPKGKPVHKPTHDANKIVVKGRTKRKHGMALLSVEARARLPR